MRAFKQMMSTCVILAGVGLMALSCDFFESSDDDTTSQGLSSAQLVQRAYDQLDDPQGTVTPGKIGLRLNSIDGISIWLDSKPTPVEREMQMNLATGQRQLTFAIDRDTRTAPLRVELVDLADQPTQAQFVSGK